MGRRKRYAPLYGLVAGGLGLLVAGGLAVVALPAGATDADPGTVAAPVATTAAAASPSSSAAPSAAPSARVAASRSVQVAATGCGRKAGSAPVTRVSRVTLPEPVVGYGGEGDTEQLPMAVSPRAGGGSWLAWLSPNGRVYLGKLDCRDKLVGTPTSFTGVDLQDVRADRNGGVLLLTRKGACRTGPLCGGASSPCRTMHMVRFDSAGKQVWTRQVTNLTGQRGGYDDGARFVWWYQHHGRLAYDGKNYAAYFGTAITVRNGSCVDIHQGDRMQVVGPGGTLLAGRGSTDFGCSHSWTTRIVWDKRVKRFETVCATDNGCRIARPAPYRTVAAGRCDGTLFGGDLVLASGSGYWTAWSQGGTARLTRYGSGAANRTLDTGVGAAHPHLVRYGPGRMLMAWESGAAMRARVYSAYTGRPVGAAFRIGVRDHSYQAFKDFPDGSAAYPAAGGGSSTVNIARVMPAAR